MRPGAWNFCLRPRSRYPDDNLCPTPTRLGGEVVRREAQTGEDVLRAAFDLHYAALIRLCLALGEQPGDAEDIVQEAYVRAAPSLNNSNRASFAPTCVGPL